MAILNRYKYVEFKIGNTPEVAIIGLLDILKGGRET